MNFSRSMTSTSWSSRVLIVLKYVFILAFVGAVLAGIAGAVMFGTGPTPQGLTHDWAFLMAPVFALIGAIMGAVYGLVIGLIRALTSRT